jgi:hypothetical protein
MKQRVFSGLFALFVVAAGAATAGRLKASGVAAAYDGEPELIAATFSSAWCAACAVLEPKLAKAIPRFRSDPVAFVEFDFTFGPREETRAEAERYGLGALYERNKGATGFTLLVDADTGKIIDTLTMSFSEGAIRSAIARALAIASHTEKTAEAASAAAD